MTRDLTRRAFLQSAALGSLTVATTHGLNFEPLHGLA